MNLLEELYAQKPYVFLWTPVFVALGIGAYFSLPVEPPFALGVFLCLAYAALVALFSARPVLQKIILFALLVALGFCAAQVRTMRVYTPILSEDMAPITLRGRIAAIEDQDEGSGRLVLEDIEIEDVPPDETPRRIRIRTRSDDGLAVGQRIETLAGLHQPSAPVIPGGFDFQRYLFFQGIGAVGFIYKEITVLEDTRVSSFGQMVERLRRTIAMRIESAVPHPEAGIVIALMTGRKTAIAEEDNEAMRAAGLAHMLAISGLHVGLFSGAIFFIMRLLMACVPGMALHHPIKKYAAVLAVMAAAGYMLLAGASIPSQRALLMTSVVFLAIILDRSPISLRLVAFAALVVLLLFPESLLSASFHMSFAAVTGLIVFYDRLRPVWSAWHRRAGIGRRAALYFAGVCMTTVVATFATAPFALFHFNQLAVYGLIGNLLCVPILAFVIMPLIVGALFLMPFGLAYPVFVLMDYGVRAVLDVARWVESLPHAVLHMPSWPLSALVLIVGGTLFMMLWQGRFRWGGIVPLVVASVLIGRYQLPDILVAPDIRLVAVADKSDGSFYVSTRRSARFVRENWMESFGLEEGEETRFPKEGEDGPIKCDEFACRIALGGKTVSYMRSPLVQARECAEADIVISTEPLRDCYPQERIAIDLFDVHHKGAHALWLSGDAVRLETSADPRGRRPWVVDAQ